MLEQYCGFDVCGREPFRSLYAPTYSFNHPTVQRLKLGAVKTELFNPGLASLKRYDMDNVSGKPPEEHGQNTTTLCLGSFYYLPHSNAIALDRL